MNACRECGKGLAKNASLDICPRCRRLEIYRTLPRGECGDCAVTLGPKNRSGYCSTCNTARQNADPEFQERRLDGLREKWNDPEFAEAVRKRAQRMGQKYGIDPELRARRVAWGKYAYANWLSKPEVRARANGSPNRGKKVSAARMAWCPEELRPRYRRLVKRMKADEARVIVLREWADRQALKHVDSALTYLRRLAPVQSLENGYRVGFSDVLPPSEVVRRAELQGWEPERWAA